MGKTFSIECIGPDSPLLGEVMLLHAASKSTLGAFPRGAFEEAARRACLLVAVAPDKSAAGYVVYRIAKDRAAVTHLTTSSKHRGHGAASALIDVVKNHTKHLSGISARCRRDYGLTDMWSGFGFTVRHTREGRGADRALLDYWWYDHGHRDLFSFGAAQEEESDAALVAMDANVFFDLVSVNRPQGEDTKVLLADWLEGSLVLCVTAEIYAEIHRSPNEREKAKNRGAADGFHQLRTDEETLARIESVLSPLFNGAILDRDRSDMRQVAHAIGADVPFFVTRDAPILSQSEVVFEKYGLRILHPTDLINHFDVLRREAEYRPAALQASAYRERLTTADDVLEMVKVFKHPSEEKANEFERAVRHYIAHPNEWVSRVITDRGNVPVIYMVQSIAGTRPATVPVVRHAEHPLAPTLLRHLLHRLCLQPPSQCNSVISITDSKMSSTTRSALSDLGFLLETESHNWWKVSVRGVLSQSDLANAVSATGLSKDLKAHLGKAIFGKSIDREKTRSYLERVFCPVKVVSPETPCFVVSIRPHWAAHFFDIGGQTLMDLNETLHLGIEAAYYCAASNTHLRAPGRVLWYVSSGPKGEGRMAVMACSHIEELVSAGPKELFSRFHHLGIFQWKHVLKTAAGRMENKAIAFRFTRTERFIREVPLAELQKLGIPQPQNPRRITDAQFAAIYKIGMDVIEK